MLVPSTTRCGRADEQLGEIPFWSTTAARERPDGRGGIVIRANDFNPERRSSTDVIRPTPAVAVVIGSRPPVSAVVRLRIRNFKFLVRDALPRSTAGLTREVTQAQRRHELAIATST